MGKGDHRGKKHRKLAKVIGLPTLAPVKSSRKKRGGDGKFIGPQEDARLPMFNARCRHNGMEETDDNRRIVSHPAYEGHATLAIMAAAEKSERGMIERDRLLSLWNRIDGAHAAHSTHVMNRPRFPNVARMEILPEAFEARPDDKPDPRTPDEKAADAKAAWDRWRSILRTLTGHERVMIDDGLFGVREFVRGGKPTTSGQAFVAAVRVIHGMVER